MKALWRPAITLGLLLSVTAPGVADADGQGSSSFTENANWPQPQFQARVESHSDGVDVRISARETVPGHSASSPQAPGPASPPPAASPSGAQAGPSAEAPNSTIRSWSDDAGFHSISADGHQADLAPTNVSSASQRMWTSEFQAHPDQMPYVLTIDNQFQDIVWVPNQPGTQLEFGPSPQPPPNTPGAGCGGCTDARQVALDMVTHIPLPPIKLRVNPDIGLVGMAGWFWVDGYQGETIQASRTVTVPPPAPGLPPTSFTVTVRLRGEDYAWAFGDGKSLDTTSLGKPYPTESDIQHKYEHSSLPFAQGFPVYLTVRFHAEFSVNGGPPQGLPPIQHTWEANHPVQEIQAVLNRQS